MGDKWITTREQWHFIKYLKTTCCLVLECTKVS
jgi:hypothetical protein